jgi:hypothetical protein
MTEQNNSRTEDSQRELWPGRYTVEAVVERWPHREYIYKDVWLGLFQVDMTPEEARALLEPLGFTPDMEDRDYAYTVSYVEATFSEQQADKLIAFLESHSGTKAEKKPAEKPYPGAQHGLAGIQAMAYGSLEGHYPLHEEEDYNLAFKAEAYYSVDDAECIGRTSEAELRHEIDEAISLMDADELDELQEWIDGRHERDMKQALLGSINCLISDMSVEQLEQIEGYIARIED